MADLLAGFLFAFFGLFLFLKGLSLPEGRASIPGPRFWPNIIAIGLMVSGLSLTGKSFFSRPRSLCSFNMPWRHPKFRQLTLLFCVTILYLLFWSVWQFFVPTFLFLSAAMYLLHPKQIFRILFIALVFTVAVYSSFYWGLHIPLD